jgi:hypothetical protein
VRPDFRDASRAAVVAVFLVFNAAAVPQAVRGGSVIQGIERLPPEQIEAQLPNAHPVNYYVYAQRFWAAGDKERALYWLSIGQLRFHFLLAAHPADGSAGGAALLESLESSIGDPILAYARSVPKIWTEQIDAALRWDEGHPNGITSESQYRTQWLDTRAQMVKARDQISARTDRVPSSQQSTMPADWPKLNDTMSLDQLVGTYATDLRLSHSLFLGQGAQISRATTYEFSRDGADSFIVIARRGDQELLRKTLPVQERADAIVVEEESPGNGREIGSVHETVYLRRNTAGDLVVESRWHTAQGDVAPFWFRVARVSQP